MIVVRAEDFQLVETETVGCLEFLNRPSPRGGLSAAQPAASELTGEHQQQGGSQS
jgi:hypothetical protein